MSSDVQKSANMLSYHIICSTMKLHNSSWELAFPPPGDLMQYRKQHNPIWSCILIKLRRRCLELWFLFGEEFDEFQDLGEEQFSRVTNTYIRDFNRQDLSLEEFIWFCVVVAYFGYIAFDRGVRLAPFVAAQTITTVIMSQIVEHGKHSFLADLADLAADTRKSKDVEMKAKAKKKKK